MKTLDPTIATVRENNGYARHQYLLAAAKSDAERNEAYRIRHTAYVAQGYIAPHPSGQFSDDYDRERNCPSWLLFRQGKAVGSIRTCIHLGMEGWNRMPCREVFGDVIEASFPPHLRLVELSRISVAGGGELSDDSCGAELAQGSRVSDQARTVPALFQVSMG